MGLGALIGVSAGSALLGAGTSISANKKNAQSVSDTNAANMAIAQMNNEWSEKMAQKQMDYNTMMNEKQFGQAKELQQIQNDYQTEMWNKTNEYNSASAQRQRLEDAGLNPYLMMSGGSSGSAVAMNGSSVSAPSSGSIGLPSPSHISAIPSHYDFSGVGSSIMAGLDMYNQLKIGSEQADILSADNSLKKIELQYKSKQIVQELANQYAEQKNTEARTQTLDTMRDIERSQLIASTDNVIQQTQNLKETLKSVVIQNCADMLNLKNVPTEIALRNSNIAATTSLMVAQKQMTQKQAINEIKKGLILDYQGQKEKISADYAERMARNLYFQAESTLRSLQNNEGARDAGQYIQSHKSDWFKDLYFGIKAFNPLTR